MSKNSARGRRAALVFAHDTDAGFASTRPRYLHPLLGQALVAHVVQACQQAGYQTVIAICQPETAEALQQLLGNTTGVVSCRGSSRAAAVRAGLAALPSGVDELLLVPGDQPLLSAHTLRDLARAKRRKPLALLTGRAEAEVGVAALQRDGRGRLQAVKTLREPAAEAVEVDAGVWLIDRTLAAELFAGRGSGGLKGALQAAGHAGTQAAGPSELLWVRDRLDLVLATRLLRARINQALMLAGVGLEDPTSTLIEPGVVVEADASLGANVQLRGQTRVAAGAQIEANVVVIDCTIEAGAQIRSFSHLEGAVVRAGAIVGPFARLRPLAEIGEGAHIGNFVEVKKTTVEAGAKANHLAYLGDARIGSKANIGAGTITCNYDGVAKHPTDIGAGVFVGSNSTLVAPIKLEDGAYVAAGSTLTKDVPADALAFGRARQNNKPKLAAKLRTRMKNRADR